MMGWGIYLNPEERQLLKRKKKLIGAGFNLNLKDHDLAQHSANFFVRDPKIVIDDKGLNINGRTYCSRQRMGRLEIEAVYE